MTPDPSYLQDLAEQALRGVRREFPNIIIHTMLDRFDAVRPRERTPAFYGCFDWHSAVHSHWLLARLLRACPKAGFAPAAREALDSNIQHSTIEGEIEFVLQRPSFEVPYGLAWLTQLQAELEQLDRIESSARATILEPLTTVACRNLNNAFTRLPRPIRTGEHNQTALAMALVLDACETLESDALVGTIRDRARSFFASDRNAPIDYEPSGYDFVSPTLAEADLMTRICPPDEYPQWFDGFLPRVNAADPWLQPVASDHPSDGKLAHLDGLNLSRAWMLENIGRHLPEGHSARRTLLECAHNHRAIGIANAITDEYMGSHWLGTFALKVLEPFLD